ncbi:MAG: hypothetical protein K8953_13250 [Proteobacteria bacterium]|nr:hypothetical protein [Pseudomonadota bacterium]
MMTPMEKAQQKLATWNVPETQGEIDAWWATLTPAQHAEYHADVNAHAVLVSMANAAPQPPENDALIQTAGKPPAVEGRTDAFGNPLTEVVQSFKDLKEKKEDIQARLCEELMSRYPNMVDVRVNDEATKPFFFVDWRDGGQWVRITVCDMHDEIDKMLDEERNLPNLEGFKDSLTVQFAGKLRRAGRGTLLQDWNGDDNTMPLADGVWSIDLDRVNAKTPRDLIIATPKENLVFKRLPVFLAEIPETHEEWLAGRLYTMLTDWFKDDLEKIQFLGEALGTGLASNLSKSFLVFEGAGGDGKTMLTELIRATAGETDGMGGSGYADTTPLEVYVKGGKYDPKYILSMMGARFSLPREIEDSDAFFNLGILKAVASGDRMDAWIMYHGKISFKVKALPIVVGNKLMKSKQTGLSIRRRLKIMTFKQSGQDSRPDTITGREEDSVLKSVRGQSLFWWLTGLIAFNNRPGSKLMPCKAVEARVNEYLAGENWFLDHFDEFFVKTLDGTGETSVKTILNRLKLEYEPQYKYKMPRDISGYLKESFLDIITKKKSDGLYILGYLARELAAPNNMVIDADVEDDPNTEVHHPKAKAMPASDPKPPSAVPSAPPPQAVPSQPPSLPILDAIAERTPQAPTIQAPPMPPMIQSSPTPVVAPVLPPWLMR